MLPFDVIDEDEEVGAISGVDILLRVVGWNVPAWRSDAWLKRCMKMR